MIEKYVDPDLFNEEISDEYIDTNLVGVDFEYEYFPEGYVSSLHGDINNRKELEKYISDQMRRLPQFYDSERFVVIGVNEDGSPKTRSKMETIPAHSRLSKLVGSDFEIPESRTAKAVNLKSKQFVEEPTEEDYIKGETYQDHVFRHKEERQPSSEVSVDRRSWEPVALKEMFSSFQTDPEKIEDNLQSLASSLHLFQTSPSSSQLLNFFGKAQDEYVLRAGEIVSWLQKRLKKQNYYHDANNTTQWGLFIKSVMEMSE